jgi:hypothetical protein
MTERNDVAEGNVWPDAGDDQPLICYVIDLEELVRWFALMYSYEDQEGVRHQNDPIWTVWDDSGNYHEVADRLSKTWRKVMHDAD